MDEYIPNVAREIGETFKVSEDNKICGYECTQEFAEFMRKNGDFIVNYAKHLYYREEREKKQRRLFENYS